MPICYKLAGKLKLHQLVKLLLLMLYQRYDIIGIQIELTHAKRPKCASEAAMFTLPPPLPGLASVTRPLLAHSGGNSCHYRSSPGCFRIWKRMKGEPPIPGPWRCRMSSDPHPLLEHIPARTRSHRKPDAKRRSRRISVPVSPEEYEAICNMAEAHGCAITEVLRSPIVAIPPPLQERPIILAVRRHLAVVHSFLAVIRKERSLDEGVRTKAASVADATEWLRRSLAGVEEKGDPE